MSNDKRIPQKSINEFMAIVKPIQERMARRLGYKSVEEARENDLGREQIEYNELDRSIAQAMQRS